MCTLEAIIKVGENFPGDFEVNQRLMPLHGKVGKHILKVENSEAVGAIIDETFSL